jgi:benzoylformate decarboxylase
MGGNRTGTVRDAALDAMRAHGLTRIFGNPGSTEIPFLGGLPDDFEFVLGLHEGSVVGMATGYALGRGAPSFVNLHVAAGLGNAVNAIVGARDNRAPLVIVVGQQDRRHLALSPFLAGRSLERLAGDHPVWTSFPPTPQDLPGAIARAAHEASLRRGPTLVVAPMGDWSEPAGDGIQATPARVLHAPLVDPEALAPLAELVRAARAPALVVGAGLGTQEGWDAVVPLAEGLDAPVWQEAFGSRAGFPQDHPLFAGHLPPARPQIRAALDGRDLVLVLGTPALRLYLYDDGPIVEPGTVLAGIVEDPDEALRSVAELVLLAPPAAACRELARRLDLPARPAAGTRPLPEPPPPPSAGERLRAGHVLSELQKRLPADATLVEEAPSNRLELLDRIPVRTPHGYLSVANGTLGFGLTAAIGLRMALPERPVAAVLGDGAAAYVVQALWSAARYRAGALLIVLNNGGYAVMDELAHAAGSTAAWPPFGEELSLAAVATGFGCPSRRVETHEELLAVLDDVMPRLRELEQPLLLEVVVAPNSG